MQSLLGLVGPDFVVSTAHVLIVCEEDASMGVVDCCHIRTTLLINSWFLENKRTLTRDYVAMRWVDHALSLIPTANRKLILRNLIVSLFQSLDFLMVQVFEPKAGDISPLGFLPLLELISRGKSLLLNTLWALGHLVELMLGYFGDYHFHVVRGFHLLEVVFSLIETEVLRPSNHLRWNLTLILSRLATSRTCKHPLFAIWCKVGRFSKVILTCIACELSHGLVMHVWLEIVWRYKCVIFVAALTTLILHLTLVPSLSTAIASQVHMRMMIIYQVTALVLCQIFHASLYLALVWCVRIL